MKRILSIVLLIVTVIASAARAEEVKRLWVYYPVNFQVDDSTNNLLSMMERAKKAGYTGFLITDYKFGRIEDRPKNYYANIERARATAEKLNLEIAAACMPIGYSNEILQLHPDLAEGIEVKDAPYVVHGDKATVESMELMEEGGLEKPGKNQPAGFDWIDGYGKSTTLDTAVKHGGNSSLRMSDFKKGHENGMCRLVKAMKLQPWSQYHFSAWIKTQDMANVGEFKFNVLNKEGLALTHTNLGVKPTQDWTQHDIVFNTQDSSDVNVYLGIWGGSTGAVWIDDLSLRMSGAVNMVRRPGAPIRVASADGKTEFAEGKDFAKWTDPKTGRDPYESQYTIYHDEPAIVIPAGSRIKEGDKLRVGYYHTVTVYDGQISACLTEPQLYEDLQRETALLEKYLHPQVFFMSHDEMRLAGQCGLCKHSGKTAGQLLAENVKRCQAMIHQISPKAQVMVWSDMFDPKHNAVDKYYLVPTTIAGSWEGLEPATQIANWNGDHRAESLKFFADRKHAQLVAGYYDDPNVEAEVEKWKAAAKPIGGVSGWMYTTWNSNYDNLERYAKAVRGSGN
jgi:hypothetical protein